MSAAREQIIEATCGLMERQGYHATGLSQIIKESGSPKGSLYYYFPGGKEELAAAALHHVGELVRTRIRASLDEHPDPVQAIPSFIHVLAGQVERSGYSAGGPITTVAMETASTSEPLREVCEQIYGSWQAAFQEKLVSGGFETSRAESLAAAILCAIEGGIILCRTRRSRGPLEAVAGEVGALLAVARQGSA
ncbi:MAG: TetR/AcrR family transcriptional regulator [Anaerolineae bacterium]|nr:TetR/AcrR family transcriptional regulator [Anaerolineae bacterium]